MSASLAAARKRRGAPPPESSPINVQSQQPLQPPVGLTLPQVISLVDKRLIIIETFIKEQKENQVLPEKNPSNGEQSLDTDFLKTEIENMAEEFNNRYELLATEIQAIKDIVLKLQSYTMEVNKTLVEERVRIFSEIDNSSKIEIGEDLEENA